MARVLITGSADGLGRLAAERLIDQGHSVTLHARGPERADDARAALPAASGALVGDLAEIAGMRAVAEQANDEGRYDAVIHNAGVGYHKPRRVETADGLEQHFAVNVLAPYLLTALIDRPGRLVYLSSGMHRGGDPDLSDPQWAGRRWNGMQAYSDSKLFVTILAAQIARLWPGTPSNAVDPGWVATKMGGAGAPDDPDLGSLTQAWLAVEEETATITGGYFFHQEPQETHPAVHDEALGARLVEYCAKLSGEPVSG
ncbi:SDR family NAD(P)-dependent oxidoreductase [Actinomadura sp. DC4]|uniref:SDR family NAD(P)-dependent oxidoreductase n=1 Tax=Actinomadura sp. DC4 TaxID=3055069 RepID=UPI0025AEDE08|nr:SDR family NAD(P)-dependent oxidoreductase [Actinomadura sp. DC4]MDN3353786.1 SDR family NAD(P)-dependent oxidoreductase [Actinomadura sp. DC4]